MSNGKTSRNYWAFGAKGWGVALAGVAFYFFWQGPLFAGSNFWFTALNQMFGWSVPSLALPISIAGIISIFGCMLFGALAKKYGAKRVIVICMILAAASDMIFATMQTLISFQISVVLFFFFSMGYSVIGVGQLGADWFPRKKGVYMGVVTVGAAIMTASISMILALSIPTFGIFNTLAVYSVIQVVIAAFIAIFIKNTPEEAGAYPDNDKSVTRDELMLEYKEMEEYKKNSPWTVKTLLSCSTTWKIAIAWGLCMMCGVGVVQQLVQTLASFGHSVMLGITILTVAWPIGILGHIFTGVIDLRFGTRNTSILMAVILALASIALITSGTNTVGAVLGAGLFLLGVTGIANVTMSMTTTSFGRKDFENAWPVISTIFQLISNAGVAIIAILAAAVSYRASLFAVLGIVIVAMIIMFATPKSQIAPPNTEKAAAK